MPTRKEHPDRFVEAGVTSGRCSDVSEVVREGLRLLEQREQEDRARVEWLRAAAKEGFDAADRGDYTALRSDQELDDFVDRIRRDVTAKHAGENAGGYAPPGV